MKLSKKKALEICLELWTWLAETGGEYKEDWPEWEKYGYMKHNCPCCEYTKKRVRGDSYSHCLWCPLLSFWPSNSFFGAPCCRLTSPYRMWDRTNAPPRTRKKYAQKIVDGCVEALAKLPRRKARVK